MKVRVTLYFKGGTQHKRTVRAATTFEAIDMVFSPFERMGLEYVAVVATPVEES